MELPQPLVVVEEEEEELTCLAARWRGERASMLG